MNILKFTDIEQYLQFRQVYVVKDISNTDLKTIVPVGVIDMKAVDTERINDNTISLRFNYNDKEAITIYSYETDLAFFEFVKTHFIPVHLLIEKWFDTYEIQEYADQQSKKYANWIANQVISGRTAAKLWLDYKSNSARQHV